MDFGRIELFTDVTEVTRDNLIDILRAVVADHERNSSRIQGLIDFEKGYQPLLRVKTYRADINCVCTDNLANEIVEFKQSYNWGSPITLVVREGGTDNARIAEAVSLLNRCYQSQDYNAKQQQLARFVEIGGVHRINHRFRAVFTHEDYYITNFCGFKTQCKVTFIFFSP